MIELSASDWIAVASFLLAIAGYLATNVADYFNKRHDSALARIVGMAGREAAAIARLLASLPEAADATATEHTLIGIAGGRIIDEMGTSVGVTGASADRVRGIVQAELDKLLVSRAPPIALPAKPPVPVAVPAISEPSAAPTLNR